MENTPKNSCHEHGCTEDHGEENFSDLNRKDNLDSLKEAIFKMKKNKTELVKENYKFWDTQPVPKIKSDDSDEIGPLDENNDVEKERKEPFKLPNTFSWYDIDINSSSDLTKVKIKRYF
jgi:glycylpeptide N-tetradecanoyltransferase